MVRKTIVFVTHDIDEAVKLGDRIALMSRGGALEQYATPAELLAQPASQFVEGFLGEGRMVRRLSLIALRDVTLPKPDGARLPVESVDAGASLRDALDAVLRAAEGRVQVLDSGRVIGVVDAEAIREASR